MVYMGMVGTLIDVHKCNGPTTILYINLERSDGAHMTNRTFNPF